MLASKSLASEVLQMKVQTGWTISRLSTVGTSFVDGAIAQSSQTQWVLRARSPRLRFTPSDSEIEGMLLSRSLASVVGRSTVRECA